MLFYGPSGAGKKTRITCTLKQLFGPGIDKVRRLCDYSENSNWIPSLSSSRLINEFFSLLQKENSRWILCRAISTSKSLQGTVHFVPMPLHTLTTPQRSRKLRPCSDTRTFERDCSDAAGWPECKTKVQRFVLPAPSLQNLAQRNLSGDHQRSWFSIERRSGSSPSNNGKIHVQHAYHSLRQQHEPVNCSD